MQSKCIIIKSPVIELRNSRLGNYASLISNIWLGKLATFAAVVLQPGGVGQ